MADAAAFMLMYVVYPLWVLVGLADWYSHKRTGIAVTSGLRENALHWLMYAEIGIGMLCVLFFEVTAGLLGLLAAIFVVHEVTVYSDLDYSTVRRDVDPFEQMVHSFLELMPLLSILLLAVIADLGDWSLRVRSNIGPMPYVIYAAAASLLFNALPLIQETWSCVRARGMPAGGRIEPRL